MTTSGLDFVIALRLIVLIYRATVVIDVVENPEIIWISFNSQLKKADRDDLCDKCLMTNSCCIYERVRKKLISLLRTI